MPANCVKQGFAHDNVDNGIHITVNNRTCSTSIGSAPVDTCTSDEMNDYKLSLWAFKSVNRCGYVKGSKILSLGCSRPLSLFVGSGQLTNDVCFVAVAVFLTKVYIHMCM